MGNTEIKQRFNLSFLIIKYFNIKPIETLEILLRKDVKLLFLNSESFNILIKYLEDKNDLNDLFLISKLVYKIIVSEGMFQTVKNLNTIGYKIKAINEIPNVENNIRYNDVIEYLILSFQEITINNDKIKEYIGPKKYVP